MRKVVFSTLGVVIVAGMFLTTSCNKNVDAEAEALKRENDSLVLANARTKAEYEDMLLLINDVQKAFEEIKLSENYVIMNVNMNGDMPLSVREKIGNDIELITEIIQKNKEKINKLNNQLHKSKNESAQLKEAIATLNEIIESKAQTITSLQEELAKRDIRIEELDKAVKTLSQMNAEQSEVISSKDVELNKIFYAIGTSKELRAQKIIEKRGKNLLKGDFNQDYFTTADLRNVTSINTGSKKVEILTSHPSSTYSTDKDENGFITINISNPQLFWSTSRYLVVEVE